MCIRDSGDAAQIGPSAFHIIGQAYPIFEERQFEKHQGTKEHQSLGEKPPSKAHRHRQSWWQMRVRGLEALWKPFFIDEEASDRGIHNDGKIYQHQLKRIVFGFKVSDFQHRVH